MVHTVSDGRIVILTVHATAIPVSEDPVTVMERPEGREKDQVRHIHDYTSYILMAELLCPLNLTGVQGWQQLSVIHLMQPWSLCCGRRVSMRQYLKATTMPRLR